MSWFIKSLTNHTRTALERAAQQSCQVFLQRDRACCRILGGDLLIYVTVEDQQIAPRLALDGCWEIWITQHLARVVKSGWRCLDVGANFGYYTLLLAELVGESGYITAFEPNPELFPMLNDSVRLNGFNERVMVYNIALGDKSESSFLYFDRTRIGTGSLFKTEDAALEQVVVMPLDDVALFESEKPIDLVKIDAEGAEPAIWRGMERIRARDRDLKVLLEFAPRSYEDPGAFLDAIVADGFRVQRVDSAGYPEDIDRAALLNNPGFEMLWLTRAKS